jgi:hypothetical protein
MDGVWLPAGEGQSAARGLPGSRPKLKARDCQGGGLFPLGPPPFNRGEQIACVCKAEPGQARPEVAWDGWGGPTVSGRGGARPQGQQPVPVPAKSWRPPPPQGYNSPPAPSGGAILT